MLNLDFQSFDSTINPTNGKERNGPIKAQNTIKGELLATVEIYIVEPISKIKVDKKIIAYLFTWSI